MKADLLGELADAQARVALLERKLRASRDGTDEVPRVRAEQAELLLSELVVYLKENPSVEELLPTGFVARARGQLQMWLGRGIVKDPEGDGPPPFQGQDHLRLPGPPPLFQNPDRTFHHDRTVREGETVQFTHSVTIE